MTGLQDLETPALLLDHAKLEANWRPMSARIAKLGPSLRLHVKTAKSLEVVRRLNGERHGPICISTLKEAEIFGSHGYHDVLCTVALAPNKLGALLRLVRPDGRPHGRSRLVQIN